jgi:hypothetical protein
MLIPKLPLIGLKKSLLNVFHDGSCHPGMTLVIDDRLKVWDEEDQPRVHVVPAFTPYYAPQAEVKFIACCSVPLRIYHMVTNSISSSRQTVISLFCVSPEMLHAMLGVVSSSKITLFFNMIPVSISSLSLSL